MEFIHTLNRGVDKRAIFLDDQDHFRFIHDLFEFNDEEWVNNAFYRFHQSKDIASHYIERKQRKLLVDIHTFVLMPNHYHLLLTPRVEGGVTKFMQKLNMGYAKYFNQKYERVGALFQGRFKSVPVVHEAHFLHLPFYIHFNPLDLFLPSWRERKIKDYQSALDFLGSYRWSSHLDYFGKKNFPSVTNRELLLDFFEGIEGYQKRTKEWLQEIDLELLKGRTLE